MEEKLPRFVQYTRCRLRAFLDEIGRLEDSEFPYPYPREALRILKSRFESYYSSVSKLTPESNKDLVFALCDECSDRAARYLPLLGFILRSTNVRNGFEVCAPLMNLTAEVFGADALTVKPEIRLILSSEWECSHYTFAGSDYLSEFILIGLPATESDNPLLIPLSGHELGHNLWVMKWLQNEFEPIIEKIIIDEIQKEGKEYARAFPGRKATIDDLLGLPNMRTWTRAHDWALSQAQETFCDIVGVRLFGTAFLNAYSYLVSPSSFGTRSPSRPSLQTRVDYLVKAAEAFGHTVSPDFMQLFGRQIVKEYSQADEFLLKITDRVLPKIFEGPKSMMEYAAEYIPEECSARSMQADEERILKRFKLIVPAEGAEGLSPILNAAWIAFKDDDFWKDMPHIYESKDRILKDLVMKNIEILEVEQRKDNVTPC